MIGDGVPLPDLPLDLCDVIGAVAQEEGGVDLLFLQDIQNGIGGFIVGAVIKGEVGDFFAALPRLDLLLQLSQQPEALLLLAVDRLRQGLLLLHGRLQCRHVIGQQGIFGGHGRQLPPDILQSFPVGVGHPYPGGNGGHHHQCGNEHRQQDAFLLCFHAVPSLLAGDGRLQVLFPGFPALQRFIGFTVLLL